MSSLIEVDQASARYAPDAPLAASNVSLTIARGDAVGIVGESGSGKTTVSRLLTGMLDPDGGQVLVEGIPWRRIKRTDDRRRRVQMVFQDPYGALNPRLRILDAVAEPISRWTGKGRSESNDAAAKLLHEIGLGENALGRKPGQLSGGQCQRVGIARALACEPDVLIADEPTSALDVSVQAQILNLLLRLREERNLALVLVSHDLGVVRYVTERALVMYSGNVVETGPTRELLDSPKHPYTRALLDSRPGQSSTPALAVNNDVPEDHPCAFAQRCPRITDECRNLESGAPENNRLVACVHPL